MIDLRQIQFAFAGTRVLHGIDLQLSAGELVAIIGPNGAGKSTLLRIVAGLLSPSEGTARVLGMDPFHARRLDLAKRMAHLAQSYRMAFPFTALEVVMMGRYAHSRRGIFGRESKRDRELALAALTRCDAASLAHRPLHQLSGGEQRRVRIAQALCQEAELLLLDEPSSGLDPQHARDLFQIVRAECDGGRSCLLVTHDLNLAARYADRLLLLHQGKQLACDGPAEVIASSALQDAFTMQIEHGLLPDGKTPYVVPY
jgi:iron complex transport system ATP-binding protein